MTRKKNPMSFKALNTMTGSLNISLRFDVVQIGFPKNVGEKLWGWSCSLQKRQKESNFCHSSSVLFRLIVNEPQQDVSISILFNHSTFCHDGRPNDTCEHFQGRMRTDRNEKWNEWMNEWMNKRKRDVIGKNWWCKIFSLVSFDKVLIYMIS